MVEDIGKIISKGFETYTNNINLCIPFVLNAFITGLLAIIMLFGGFFYIFRGTLSSLENASRPEQVTAIFLQVIINNFFEILVLSIVFFLILTFVVAFFTAGAIGMAKQATETGNTNLSTMIDNGRKNVVKLFLAYILVSLIYLSGVIFLVPGAMNTDISLFLSQANTPANSLLDAGFLLIRIYSTILGLVLAVFSYALVIDNLEPIDGILTGFRFFNKHKFDVFLLWLMEGFIVTIIVFISMQAKVFLPIIILILFLIIAPLITLWWVRLYMERTNKKLYFNELLAHPNDLAKLRANQ